MIGSGASVGDFHFLGEAQLAAIISFVEAYTTPLLLFVSLVTLVNHLRRKSQVTYIEVFVNSGAAGIALMALVVTSVSEKRTGLSFGEFAAMLTAYGVWLFVLICDVLRRVGAFLLTYWRGEKWVKEIDYIYLTLGRARRR